MYNGSNRTHHASDFHAQPGGTFSFMGCFMYQYPKQILTIAQQIQTYIDAGRTNGWLHTIAPAEYNEVCGAYLQAYMTGGMTKEEVTQGFQDLWDAE